MRNGNDTLFSVMGINRRNREFVYLNNMRSLAPIASSKLRTKEALLNSRIPAPKLYAVIESHREVRRFRQTVEGLSSFVIKPDHGSRGNGVFIVNGLVPEGYLNGGGKPVKESKFLSLIHEILSGEYCPVRGRDNALVEERIVTHPLLTEVSGASTADVRLILHRGQPIMAMLRLPTAASRGRANLHQNGVGAGVSMETGRIVAAIQHDRPLKAHPDTSCPLIGLEVPLWREIVSVATRCYSVIPLNYMGVDIMVDKDKGPLVVEVNLRPGLSIQNANNEGLGARVASQMQMGVKSERLSDMRWKNPARRFPAPAGIPAGQGAA
jgi:alpha-L-glutamate ligase-like protein